MSMIKITLIKRKREEENNEEKEAKAFIAAGSFEPPEIKTPLASSCPSSGI
jgi:hypothetical protein